MTSLHAYFHNRDQAAFQHHLAAADVNVRDWLGCTVLHLACASVDKAATEYVRLLLAHPGINVNLQDTESHWTALHRALYNGNITAAILLLQKSEIDMSLKDVEGYRAFDVYNTTVENTMPSKRAAPSGLELYTWGANRNASLGHGDTNDRTHPEQVVLMHHDHPRDDPTAREKISFKLQPALVRDVQMSRSHTVVLTDELRANTRACGFASAGRLGLGGGQHTQPSLLPMVNSHCQFTAIALGQDHTLALTADGTVFSWGLGRFSQLGYEVPAPHVQSSPRAIAGPLRRERVRGIAACKSASACWTDTVLYTWGKNNGQFGYDKNASPIQPIPRIVTKVTKPVISVALNDTAMACLLATHDVVLLFYDTQSRITFPPPVRLPSDFSAYRPPQAARAITTARILCNENAFATVSSAGEIFTFNVPTPTLPGERPLPIQPQRVWALRKQWSAVHDAALGSDRSLIICTQSGHVFVHSRSGGAKAPRFARVTGLQRAIAVRASDTGALAALREPYLPPDIVPIGNNLAEDLSRMRPYFSSEYESARVEPKLERLANASTGAPPSLTTWEEDDDGDGDFETELLARDAQEVLRLWDVLAQDRIARRRLDGPGQGLFAKSKSPHGVDIMLRIQSSTEIPVHGFVLSARCAVLARVLGGLGSLHDRESGVSIKLLPAPVQGSVVAGPPRTLAETPRLAITGVHAFSVLVLLHYLYTDVLLAIGDPRLARLTVDAFTHGRLQPAEAVREVQTLSRVLHLGPLTDALRGAMRRVPSPSLNAHVRAIFDAPMSVSSPDVVLRLADREVCTHSFVLRARSPFFECFFAEEVWTRDRWESDGLLRVELCHLEWRSMQYVLRFMCCGEEAEMFERLDFVDSTDELLSLLFDVMFAANELLLDQLLLICSSIVVKYITIDNISSVYMEAASLHCPQLMDSLHQYMSVNMETLLEARLLDNLSPQLIRQLASAVQTHQAAKSPFSRVQLPINLAASVHEHREWLATQDVPYPILRSQQSKVQPKQYPKASRKPSQPTSPRSKPSLPQPPLTPLLANTSEDLFCMDEALVPPLNLDVGASPLPDESWSGAPKAAGPWRGQSTPKVDMKAILAEAEQASGRTQQHITSSLTPAAVHRQKSGDGMRVSFSLPKTHHIPPTISPGGLRAAASSPAWRTPPQSGIPERHVSSSPGRAQPSTSDKEKAPTAPAMQKSWSTQSSSPGSSAVTRPARPGLGPVISPAKAKAGLTATRHTSGNAWVLPPAEPVSRSPSTSAPISFVEIQQLQSQPSTAATKERRSLRDIQAEEAELQAEAEFMMWWTAEEERIRLENEAVAASLMVQQQQPQKQQQRSGGSGRKNKKSTAPAPAEGKSSRKAPYAGERKHQQPSVGQRVPSDGKGN